jgi:hypothetical protein
MLRCLRFCLARPGGTGCLIMMRKIVSALILVPLAVAFIAFAVANRQTVVVSLDPFDSTNPAYSIALPLFALILVLLIGGVIIGGAAAWLRQGKWRRAARLAEWHARELQAEVDQLRTRARTPGPPDSAMPAEEPQRLRIPPPAA